MGAWDPRNVDSARDDVECDALSRWSVGRWALVVLAVGLWSLGAPGCVQTAECNATVHCPSAQVCYQYQCRPKCDTQQQCASDEVCTPCKPAGSSNDQGECFGEDLRACVPKTN